MQYVVFIYRIFKWMLRNRQ